MVDNGVEKPVIGVAFDGTGMGADGHIWGGEFLIVSYQGYTRMGHLEYLPLPGGDAAIKRPYRTATGYILSLLGEAALNDLARQPQSAFSARVSQPEREIIARQIERKLNTPLTSSMGRLFDAVSALAGIREEIDYEGQAAVELEMAAYKENLESDRSYPCPIIAEGEMKIVPLGDLLSAIVEELGRGVSPGKISLKFHNTIARMTGEMCRLLADETGIDRVALSGGVFQNRLLLRKTVKLLENSGFEVFTHRQVPVNDGGISPGQAVIANFAP